MNCLDYGPDHVRGQSAYGLWGEPMSGSSSPAIERGAVPQRQAMEVLQVGYLHAVVAAAGCTLAEPKPDRGLDWTLSHESQIHTVDPEPSIKVQLKSTHQVAAPPAGSHFSLTLKNDHLRKLNPVNVTIHRLLIVMLVPASMDKWISPRADHLALRHLSYWVNLAGHAVTGVTRTNVQVPTANVFDDRALCHIMKTVGAGGTPA